MYSNYQTNYSDYQGTGLDEPFVWAIVLGTVGFVILLVLLHAIPYAIVMWRLAEKAGKPGWTQIVPYYNLFVQSEIAGTPSYYPVVAAICSVAAVLPFVGMLTPLVGSVFSILILIGMLQRYTLTGGQIALILLLPIVAVFTVKDVTYRGPAPQPVPMQPQPPAHVPPAPQHEAPVPKPHTPKKSK